MRLLYGGRQPPEKAYSGSNNYAALALAHLIKAEPLTGIPAASTVVDLVSILPLGLVGSSDKVSVRFHQEHHGVRVDRGYLNILMTLEGDLLSLDNAGLPHLEGLETEPGSSSEEAASFARGAFALDTGLMANHSGRMSLQIAQELSSGRRFPTLVWRIALSTKFKGMLPIGFEYQVAANGPPRVVTRRNLIHTLDVGGTVHAMVSPDLFPDTSANPEVPEPMPHLTVTCSAGITTTDANGWFNFPGVQGPLDVSFQIKGNYSAVAFVGGSDYLQTETLSGSNNTILLNTGSKRFDTSQMNAFARINEMRDWIRGVNPSDTSMDSLSQANVNILGVCNAFFDGTSVNFLRRGGIPPSQCVNTAYSTVIFHEMGHWLNERYGSGNGSDGFGEAVADVFSMYIADSPIIGMNLTPGNFIRTGENLRQYCGDNNPGCFGQVHIDGEPLMGALWKVRVNLKASLGEQQGADLANALFNGWMLGYDQSEINSIIELQWLLLDDDNGNILDGTPHFNEIDLAFRTQGFPGVLPHLLASQDNQPAPPPGG